MPRKSQGPRLHWRKQSKYSPGVWQIRDDGDVRISTGTSSREEAEAALESYIAEKRRPSGPLHAEEMTIAQVLEIYAEEHGQHTASPERISYAIEALGPFWGDLKVSEVKGPTCRRYGASRVNKHTGKLASHGTIRRELGTLQAALQYCAREGHLLEAPLVTLPNRPAARERWFTRQEAAWLLRAARALNKDGRHLSDFILCGLYTGSRKETILTLTLGRASTFGGWVDLENGILYRKPQTKTETKKRQRPARLPASYLARLRRQHAAGRKFVVERRIVRNGVEHREMVADIRKGWAKAVKLAGEMAAKHEIQIDLTDATPHTLKHTAITWALQRGASSWDAAGYFSTSVETIERVYGHHSPDWQRSAVEAMGRKA